MSACGWSSFPSLPESGPLSWNVKFGSMYEKAGSRPDLHCAKKRLYGCEIAW